MLDREQSGREANPSAGVLDSQTVKAPHAPGGGSYNAAKQIRRCKRHTRSDRCGHGRAVADGQLNTANVQDVAGAEKLFAAVCKRWP